MSKLPEILPCPFCGQEASIEEVAAASSTTDSAAFSVGCETEYCFGQQSLTCFSRRSDAIKAWNKRSSKGWPVIDSK